MTEMYCGVCSFLRHLEPTRVRWDVLRHRSAGETGIEGCVGDTQCRFPNTSLGQSTSWPSSFVALGRGTHETGLWCLDARAKNTMTLIARLIQLRSVGFTPPRHKGISLPARQRPSMPRETSSVTSGTVASSVTSHAFSDM